MTIPNCTEFQNLEVVNNSYVCVNMTIPPPIIIQNVTENITIITKAFKFTETPQALVGSITIMVVIVCGVLCFIISGICDERKRLRSEKRIGTTNLTDFELKPID